jgi:hypothetical protein
MPLHSWRRLHGANIIAQVDPHPLGTWEAFTRRADAFSQPVPLKHRYHLLTRAQAAADRAARGRFRHKCDVSTCGVWRPWTDE